jgi:tetratricopeptide (TPR) repeat protein
MKLVVLTLLAVLLSLVGGVLIVAQIDPPEFLSFINDRLTNFGQPLLVVIGATVLPLILIVASYVASFRRDAQRRPTLGLYLLGFSLFWIVLAFVATGLRAETFFTPIPISLAGVALLVLAAGVRGGEILIGEICTAFGELLLRREKWRGASGFLGAARLFLPGNELIARHQGFALYEMGEAEQALKVLVEAYRRGERDPRLVRMLADSAFQLDEALAGDVLAEVLKLDPNNAKYGRRLVDLHLRNNRFVEALPVLERFYDPKNIEDVCLLGRLNAEQGHVERALELARHALELEEPPYKRTLADLQVLTMQAPNHPAILLALAEVNEKIKNREEAVSWYLNLLEAQAENTDARRRLIRLYRELGRLDQALPHYRALLRQEPDSPDVALEYGQVLEDRQDFDKAFKVFADFAARHPQDWRFSYHCAVNLFGLGRLAEAAESLERARTDAPTAERARVQSLAARIQAAQVERELGVLREQAHREGAPLDLRLSYVERLIAYQQAEEAMRELDLLLEQQPKEKKRIVEFLEDIQQRGGQQFVLLNLLADIYLKDRDFDRCHQLYEIMARQSLHPDEILADGCRQILRQQPTHLPSLKSHAALLLKGGHHREAARILAKLLELSPPARDDLLPMLFEVYYQMGDADRAIPYGEELLTRDSQNLNLYLRLRELFVKRDDHRGAIQVLRQALEIAPDNRQLREMLEESQTRMKEERLEQLRAQLEASPDQPELLHEMADLQAEFGRINDAITSYQRAAQNAEGNLRNLCLIKLAHSLATRQMFDLADETIAELDVREKEPEHLEEIKRYLYEVAQQFERDEQYDRTLQIYKKLFKIDAGYKDIVDKIELLSHLTH